MLVLNKLDFKFEHLELVENHFMKILTFFYHCYQWQLFQSVLIQHFKKVCIRGSIRMVYTPNLRFEPSWYSTTDSTVA